MLQVKCRTLSSNKVEISNQYQIIYGTAQGSCLGQLLFNVFCNDIYYEHVEHCILIMFADDTTLYPNHRNIPYLNYIIQEDLNKLHAWFDANSLSLNKSKTLLMKFSMSPSLEQVSIRTRQYSYIYNK